MNTTTLAYLGDAVYELMIREYVINKSPHDAGKAHKIAIKYVSSEGQAAAAKRMLADGLLNEEEERLFKRARNHRTMSRPANADARNYKVATGFEALIGFLYITEQDDRLKEIIEQAILILEQA